MHSVSNAVKGSPDLGGDEAVTLEASRDHENV